MGESLTKKKQDDIKHRSVREWRLLYARRGILWLINFALIFGGIYAVVYTQLNQCYVAKQIIKSEWVPDLLNEYADLTPIVVVSGLNVLVP